MTTAVVVTLVVTQATANPVAVADGSVTFSYTDFSSTEGLALVGDTAAGDGALRIVSAQEGQDGAAWSTSAVSSSASFSTKFTASISGGVGEADGVALVLQNSADGTAALGTVGGGIGYQGIAPSVAIEFDDFANVYDPDGNHIAITTDGDVATHIDPQDPGFSLYGAPFTAWIDYDAPSHTLSVYASQSTVQPATPIISDSIDIASTLTGNDPVYVGITGSTGSSFQNADIESWNFEQAGVDTSPPPITPPSGCDLHANDGAYATPVEGISSISLAAPTESSSSDLKWTVASQDFDSATWQFKWTRDGSFSVVPPTPATAHFTYSVTDAAGCVSNVATVAIGASVATFATTGTSSVRTPVYLGMGDSYSSGEGNKPFIKGTATDEVNHSDNSDDCHRSTAAYPYQQWRQNLITKIPTLHFLFTACSGAVIENMTDVSGPSERPKGQYPKGLPIDRQVQITQVEKFETNPHQYVRYISLTAGGNNALFAKIIQFCILSSGSSASACTNYANHLNDYNSKTGKYDAFNSIHLHLSTLYQRLLDSAPDADIFVLDYPRLFNTGNLNIGCLINPGARSSLDDMEKALNKQIESAATSPSLRGGSRLHFVELDDSHSAFDDHNLCRPVTNRNAAWIHGLEHLHGPGKKYTAHPNAKGHKWIEKMLDAEMKKNL